MPNPGKRTSPVSVLADWIQQGIDAGKRQVAAVIETVDQRLRLGRGSAPIDFDKALGQLDDLLAALPDYGMTSAVNDFLLASQLVGALNFQRRLGIATAGYDHQFMGTARWFVAASPNLDPFKQPFQIAIDNLRDRVLLDPDTFLQLERAARSRAGRIAGQQNLKLVEQIYKLLADLIDAGGTVRDFREGLRAIPELAGWGGVNPSHIRIVFQQNATMAYQAGHFASMKQADIGTYIWRGYQTSCPICEPYLDKRFSLDDTSIYPGGAHFGCDCWADPELPGDGDGTTATRISTVDNRAWRDTVARPSALQYDPAAYSQVEPLDLSTVMPDLRDAFRRYADDVDTQD